MLRLNVLLIVAASAAAVISAQAPPLVVSKTILQHQKPTIVKIEEVADSILPPPIRPNATTTTTTTTSTTTTTAAPPKPHPAPFSVTDPLSGVTCLLANFSAIVKVSWNNTLNNTQAHREIPFNFTTSYEDPRSVCLPMWNQSVLGLTNFKENLSTLLFTFTNSSKSEFALTNLTLGLNLDPIYYDGISPRVRGHRTVHNKGDLKLWSTSLHQYYECMTNGDTVQFAVYNVSDAELKLEIVFDAVQVQALMTPEDRGVFGKASLCRMDRVTNEIVPIVVGCALAALVIIVLVAYLIGRRRSRARGYESM